MSECTEAQFLKDVSEHQVEVLLDSGVYRHLRCADPKTNIRHFHVTTYPGHLCYSGDMGSFVFARIPDMFAFFRERRVDGHLQISPGYWAEKLQAVDRHDGHVEFDPQRFRDAVNSYRIPWLRQGFNDGTLDKAARRSLWEAVEFEVLRHLEDGEQAAVTAAHDFRWEGPDDRTYRFEDFWEHTLERLTFRFIWACYAIVWAIERYDEMNGAHRGD